MIFLFSIPLAILAFIFESYPRFLNREYGVDIWTHLLYLKEYHKQKGIPGKIGGGFLVGGKYDYPPIFILILSVFPFKTVEKFEFIFSPFFDSIHIVLIFIISYLLTGNILVSIFAQVFYILTPIVALENASATPRSLGYTLFTILMMSQIVFTQTHSLLWLIIAVVSGSFIFLTHRFTTQGFLFFAIIFSIVEKTPIFLGIFLVCMLLATLISKGFYFKVLSGHIGNLKFWKANIQYRFAHQVKGNIASNVTSDFVFRTYTQFLKFPPFVLAITSPWTLFVLYEFVFEFPSTNFIIQRMVIWVIVSYILAISTIWIPKLRFLGEGQRYLELSSFPTAFIASYFLFSKINSNIGFPLVFFYGLIGLASFVTIIVIQRKAVVVERMRTLTPEMKKMFNYLKSLKDKPNLLCIPHQITTNTIYHTGCPVFVNADYTNIEKISDVYPYIKKPIRKIMIEKNLDMILLNTDYATIADLKLGSYKIIHESGNFVLIK